MIAWTCRSQHALVTGASSGIGRATALRLAERGYHVFATVRKEADADRLRPRSGDRLTPVLLDVTRPDLIRDVAEHLSTHTSGLDLLVNNAGTGIAVPLEVVGLETFRSQFEVNVEGQLAVTQAMLPLIREAHGTIVMIGSIGGRITLPFAGSLASAKHAIRALSDALRRELAPWDIRVVLIEPASIRTDAIDKLAEQSEATIAGFTPEQATLYGDRYRAMTSSAVRVEQGGSPPSIVADTIVKALKARRPRTRYLSGKHARILATLARTPPRVQDRLLAKLLHQR